jgi:hypothetical protein
MTDKKKKKITPGRVTERELTKGVADGIFMVKKMPDGQEVVYDPKRAPGQRIVGKLSPSLAARRRRKA